MLIAGMGGIRLFVKVISVQRKLLVPAIMVLSLVGAFAINRNMFDVFFAIAMGGVGYLLQKYGFPLGPILLAFILGPMSESNLRRFMQIDDGQFWRIFTKPICVILISLALISLVSSVINQRKINKRLREAGAEPGS
jgi:putative tricarboxylic transport membrane protein